MPTAGPTSCGTGADDAAIGSLTWTSPGNITASEDTKTTVSGNGGAITHYLKATNFGFAIPSGATIDGILMEIEMSKSGAGNCNDSTVKIVKADASIGSENKASATNLSGTDGYRSYGGVADLWSESWTDANINDADFGVVLSITFPAASCQAAVDHVRCTITYTESGGGGTIQKHAMHHYRQMRSA